MFDAIGSMNATLQVVVTNWFNSDIILFFQKTIFLFSGTANKVHVVVGIMRSLMHR